MGGDRRDAICYLAETSMSVAADKTSRSRARTGPWSSASSTGTVIRAVLLAAVLFALGIATAPPAHAETVRQLQWDLDALRIGEATRSPRVRES